MSDEMPNVMSIGFSYSDDPMVEVTYFEDREQNIGTSGMTRTITARVDASPLVKSLAREIQEAGQMLADEIYKTLRPAPATIVSARAVEEPEDSD